MMKAPLVKTRDSTRRRYIVRSRRHVNRRAYIRRHPGGDSPPPQDRRGGVRVRGAPFMSAQRSRLLAQVVAHRRRRPSVGRGSRAQAPDVATDPALLLQSPYRRLAASQRRTFPPFVLPFLPLPRTVISALAPAPSSPPNASSLVPPRSRPHALSLIHI